MIRVSRRNLRALTYMALFTAVCSFVIGVSLSINHYHQEAPSAKNPLLTRQPHSITNHISPLLGTEAQENQKLQTQLSNSEQSSPVSKNKLEPKVFSPPTSFQGKTLRDVNVAKENKVIALTFDDGPWPKYSEQILEILKKEDIKGTFFWIGKHVKAFPEIALKVVAEGHTIGNHTWSHSYRKMNKDKAFHEIDDTARIIENTTKVKTTLFRPPGGILTNGPAGYALSQKYAVLMWSADSTDYVRRMSVNTLVNKVLNNAKPGGIVLMHDGGGDRQRTVQALPIVIKSLKKQGYKFVSIPELMAMEKTKAGRETRGQGELIAPKPLKAETHGSPANGSRQP